MSAWLIAASLAGCRVPEPVPVTDDDDPTTPDTDTSVPTDTPTDTGRGPTDSTTTPTTPTVCEDLPPGPYTFVRSTIVHTEEDFDFDRQGYLLLQSNQDLVGVLHDGSQQLLATSIGFDVAGIRSLPTDDIVVAQQDTGALRRVNRTNGNTVTVLAGLDYPNGIDVDSDGWVYISEYSQNGRVRRVDPYTGEATVILETRYPNGLALSPDEQTLYVVVSQQLFAGDGKILAMDRDPTSGEWLPETRVVYHADDLLDAITVDVCGNVYAAEYRSGKVVRISMPDETAEIIIDLPNSGFEGYCAARFGAGWGDWSRTTLYVSDRSDLYGIELGVEGRHVLANESTTTSR
ncbi:MAG: SMP-30/gluconolactonase/LRE family protein [Myxococcota bacterium]